MTDVLPIPQEPPKRGRGRPRKDFPISAQPEYKKTFNKAYYAIHREAICKQKQEAYALANGVSPKIQCEYVGPVVGRCPNRCRGRSYCFKHVQH